LTFSVIPDIQPIRNGIDSEESVDEQNKPKNQVKITIQADDQDKQGRYSNMAMITHSPEEFVADFLMIFSQPPFGKLQSRVIMSPGHAKRLQQALTRHIEHYEKSYGPIREAPAPSGVPEIVH